MSLKDIEKELNELKKNTGLEFNLQNCFDMDCEDILKQLTYINRAYKEKYDINYFWKNILNGTADEEIFAQSKSYGVSEDTLYGVVVVESKNKITSLTCQVIGQMFPVYLNNYIVKINENMIALVHCYSKDDDTGLEDIAYMLRETITTEAMMSVKISYSEQYNNIYELHDAFDKAITALDIGKMFYYKEEVFAYKDMGMGEMICGLSDEACRKFLNSIPNISEIEKLDPDLINAVTCFLDNNLNIAETSRQVHMHRNTLVYRIEQIEKKTGLDIREFEDAMKLKVTLMVLKSREAESKDDR